MEIRALQNCELRTAGNHKLVGYAAVFNQLSEPLGNFRELIRPGAFTRTLQAGADVRALVDHDPSRIIGRTKSGTLQLREDNRGLLANIDLPDTSVGHDLYESVKRGDLSSMSFGFRSIEDTWPTRDRRELIQCDLLDVSVVTFPAYPQTEVQVRGATGEKVDLCWYRGDDQPLIVVPEVGPLERLRLKLALLKKL